MWNSMLAFFAHHRQRKEEAIYNNGYAYACGELISGRETPLSLESYLSYGVWGAGSHTAFDRGVRDATNDVLSMTNIEDDRF